MDIASLNESFGLPGQLAFEDYEGMTRAVITTASASAVVYLQGAHIAHWQPLGEEPVLFMSRKSAFLKGKAIRGGVPLIFPWFGDRQGDRHDGPPSPAHGFARAADWTIAFAALVGEDVHLTFTLAPSDASRALGFDHFRVAYQLTIGRTLTLQLTVANDAPAALLFEEALHTYLSVGDIHRVSITGLHATGYIDKRDHNALKVQVADPLVLTRDTDSVYLDSTATCIVHDPSLHRSIVVAKTNSATTIVWNPWTELTAKLADMEPEGWVGMVCVETANAAKNSITLAPGDTHAMHAVISVQPLDAPTT